MSEILICLAVGYGCGCLLSAVIVSRGIYHKDIFSLGTGNPGMANVMAQEGFRAGLMVLAGDLAKTVFPCLILRMIFGTPAAAAWTGLGAVLGHMYPVWHRFRGGKGVACLCAAIFSVFPLRGLASMIGGLIAVLATRYLAVGAVVIPTLFTAVAGCTDNTSGLLLPLSLLTAVIWIRHLPALYRIARHQEKSFDLPAALRKKFGGKRSTSEKNGKK